MAESILSYNTTLRDVRPSEKTMRLRSKTRTTQALTNLASTVGELMHENDMIAIRESQKAAERDIIQGKIDPDREANDEAYAGAVLRNRLYNTGNQLSAELDNPASEHSNMNPEEYAKMLQDESNKFYSANAKSKFSDTQAEIYSAYSLQAQRVLLAKQAKAYKENMKVKQGQEAIAALSQLPPGDEANFDDNTHHVLSKMMPDSRFTFEEQLNVVLSSALAAASNGDGRLLQWAERYMDADLHKPNRVAQAQTALVEWQRGEQDKFYANEYKRREDMAKNGTYTTWEDDITDPEKVRRFSRSTINRWRRESHAAHVENNNINTYRDRFRAQIPMTGAPTEMVQKIYDMELREILSTVKDGDNQGKVMAFQQYAQLLAAQGAPHKELKETLDAFLARPVFTAEAWNKDGFQDAIVLFRTLDGVLTPEQMIAQVGKEAYYNGKLAMQAFADAEGNAEEAGKIFQFQQNSLKDRPKRKSEFQLHRNEVQESVERILDGDLPGSDPNGRKWFGLSTRSGDGIHTTAIEYHLQREFDEARIGGMNKDAAWKHAEAVVASKMKYFGNEQVWTNGADISGALNMPPSSTKEDLTKAWELLCAKLDIDPDKAHFKMAGNQGVVTDADGVPISKDATFPLGMIGKLYSTAIMEEMELAETMNEATKAMDIQTNNQFLEMQLNQQYGQFNDTAQMLRTGETLGDYRYADEEERLRMRQQYHTENRSIFHPFLKRFYDEVEKIKSGYYREAEKDRYKTIANHEEEALVGTPSDFEEHWKRQDEAKMKKAAGKPAPAHIEKQLPKLPGLSKKTPEFKQKLVSSAEKIGVKPAELAAIMQFESGLDHTKTNKRSKAYGLIQFTGPALKDLGVTKSELKKMSADQQMDLVVDYFQMWERRGKKIRNLRDMYMTVLWPNAVGKGPDYVLWKKGTKQYNQNRGLDQSGDGTVTAQEAASKVYKLLA